MLYKKMDLKLLCWLWRAAAIAALKRWKNKIEEIGMKTEFKFSLTKSVVRMAQNQLCTQAPVS